MTETLKVWIPVDDEMIDNMISIGLLAAEDADDEGAIAEALQQAGDWLVTALKARHQATVEALRAWNGRP